MGEGALARVEGKTAVGGSEATLSLLLKRGGASLTPGLSAPKSRGLGQVIPPLEASVFSPVKWG